MNGFTREFLIAARQAPSIYLAPLVGAIQGYKLLWGARRALAPQPPADKSSK